MNFKLTQPRDTDWNYFWSLKQSHRFSKMSWSKKRILDLLSPFTRRGKWALDAGCGSGFFSKYFCDEGMDVVSLDYSQSALEIAHTLTKGRSKL